MSEWRIILKNSNIFAKKENSKLFDAFFNHELSNKCKNASFLIIFIDFTTTFYFSIKKKSFSLQRWQG